MLPQVYLVRHGATSWSSEGRHTGRTEIPLTVQGERNARGLAARLGAVAYTHVFTSPRLRARRTCELAGLGGAAEIDPDLAEWDYGGYEGMNSADVLKSRPDWNLFRDGCPGGESPAQVSGRADRLIARLRRPTTRCSSAAATTTKASCASASPSNPSPPVSRPRPSRASSITSSRTAAPARPSASTRSATKWNLSARSPPRSPNPPTSSPRSTRIGATTKPSPSHSAPATAPRSLQTSE